ncbi:hypothetical protein [Ornithinimicrobium flavum]|uniref:hypothetical protein n=1 Tax=Ornithinimicrobium flavum TaxID=1288636 RepID=UPI0014768B09|nr:hypothetical protein [Ornithinimicrobium flavum]
MPDAVHGEEDPALADLRLPHLRDHHQPRRAADIVRGVWDIIAEGFLNIFRFFNMLMNGG